MNEIIMVADNRFMKLGETSNNELLLAHVASDFKTLVSSPFYVHKDNLQDMRKARLEELSIDDNYYDNSGDTDPGRMSVLDKTVNLDKIVGDLRREYGDRYNIAQRK